MSAADNGGAVGEAPIAGLPSTLALRRDGAVLHITLNRPETRNAMSLQMVYELRRALVDAEAAGDLRVIVLRGAGGHFCAGADLRDMAAARARNAERGVDAGGDDAIAELSAAFGALCVAYAATGLATVALVEGTVMGGGFGLACVTDVTIAGDNAVFRLPETSLGVVPAQIAPFLVERLGYSEARRLAVTGGQLDARSAHALRLVHEVHPSGALDHALARVLAQIQRGAPGSIAATKALIGKARFSAPGALVDEAARVFSQAVQGAEGVEGTTAFLEKRPPKWAPG